MGRRSINTTKSGKFMNPTDQARKEARKKELKKNKKQRQMVRAAVLKGKDPMQLLDEMAKIDQMEYNVLQPSPLNEKVLKEKRRKLKEMFDRVSKMYAKDDLEKWVELRRAKSDYEKRRIDLIMFYESVKHAQQVQIDDIPLPSMNDEVFPPSQYPSLAAAHIPLPGDIVLPSGVLQRNRLESRPPGVPPGPPPDLSEYSDSEGAETKSHRFSDAPDKQVKPTSVQQRMVALSGQNLDDFMKEMESAHKKRDKDKDSRQMRNEGSDDEGVELDKIDAPPGVDPSELSGMRLFRPPPMMPGMNRLPPGPPPGLPPRMGMRLPPGPPPGIPPRLIRMPPIVAQQAMAAASSLNAAANTPNVLSAGPQLIRESTTSGPATITAKPQIKNINADVTRFVPSTLRVKREDRKTKSAAGRAALVSELKREEVLKTNALIPVNQPTKDDAYMQFMNEMEGLL